MPNFSTQWNQVPIWAFLFKGDGVTPETGKLVLTMTDRVTRVDGRLIYPEGASVTRTIGDDAADTVTRDAVRAAWRAADQAAVEAGGGTFDGAAWDAWWTVMLTGAVFASFPASDDPDIVQTGYQVKVAEQLSSGSGKVYYVQPLLAHLDTIPPGINLGLVEVPPGSPTAPAPIYAKGLPGGVASLDDTGVVPLDQLPVDQLGGGGGTGGPITSADITDATTVGKSVLTAASQAAARTAIGAGTSSFSGAYTDLTGAPAIPNSPGDIGAQPAGDYATNTDLATKANTADLATVATSGSYNDLANKPTIPAAYTDEQAQDAVGAAIAAGTQSGISVTFNDATNAINFSATGTTSPDATTTSKGIVQLAGDLGGTADAPTVPGLANKVNSSTYTAGLATKADTASLAAVATSGSYTDLSNKPTIPAAYTDAQAAAAAPVQSVNSKTGAVALTAADVGALDQATADTLYVTQANAIDLEGVEDDVAGMFTGGTHSGISFAYDDTDGHINATVTGGSGTGLPSNAVTETAAYTAAAGDFVQADATSAAFTVTLPTAPTVGALVAVKKVDTSANVVTVAPAGSGTIDGDPNATIVTKNAGAVFEHVGSDVWQITAVTSAQGPQGDAGATGPAGPTGPQGPAGTNGQGVPTGGTTGQVLAKASSTDFDATWTTPSAGGGGVTVQDEGTALTARPTIDFVGAGVSATDDAANSRTVVTIPGGGGSGGAAYTAVATLGRPYMSPPFAGSFGNTGVNAGQLYGIPIFLPAGRVTRFLIPAANGATNVTGSVRMGLYSLSESGPDASTLALDAGTTDALNSGATRIINTDRTITAGWYLLALMSNEARQLYSVQNAFGLAAAKYVNAGTNVVPDYGWLGASGLSGSALPATFGGSGVGNNIIPVVLVEMGA